MIKKKKTQNQIIAFHFSKDTNHKEKILFFKFFSIRDTLYRTNWTTYSLFMRKIYFLNRLFRKRLFLFLSGYKTRQMNKKAYDNTSYNCFFVLHFLFSKKEKTKSCWILNKNTYLCNSKKTLSANCSEIHYFWTWGLSMCYICFLKVSNNEDKHVNGTRESFKKQFQ